MQTGYIMSGDIPVASFSGRAVTPILPALAPLCFRVGGDLNTWLELRAADNDRPNIRALKRLLHLDGATDVEVALFVHGATITDNYWVRFDGEPAPRWEDVRFSQDALADLALLGGRTSSTKPFRCSTPELTNTGSYEKCWKLEDGRWVMFKRGTQEGIFSEVFVAELGKLLGFPMAEYWAAGDCVVSPDFTGGRLNLEPMAYLTGEDEDYRTNYTALKHLKPGLEQEYLDILFMDALTLNVDRHTQNFGILRDRSTGNIISIAPNYDNNQALISRGYADDPTRVSNVLVDIFHELLREEGVAYQLPALEEEAVRKVANRIMPEADIDREYVVRFVMANYQKLQ